MNRADVDEGQPAPSTSRMVQYIAKEPNAPATTASSRTNKKDIP
jgi:hypothetical protein